MQSDLNKSQGAQENLSVRVVGRKPVNSGWWCPVADHHVTRCWLLMRPAAREKMREAGTHSAEVCPCQSDWPQRWMRGKRSQLAKIYEFVSAKSHVKHRMW